MAYLFYGSQSFSPFFRRKIDVHHRNAIFQKFNFFLYLESSEAFVVGKIPEPNDAEV